MDSTTILVVDDMEINRVILRELFQQTCTVLEAENGKIALEVLEEHPEIDIVIMDIVMPVMDGFETLHAIRENGRFLNLPVVICTEHAEVDMQVRALDLGSTDFITKPFNARVVRHRIRNLIEVRQMERKIAKQQHADQLHAILNSIVSPLGLFEYTGNTVRAIYLNQGVYDMFSSSSDTLRHFSSNMLQTLVPQDAEQLMDLFKQNQEDGTPIDITYRLPQKDGAISVHQLNALSIKYEHFENPVYLASITDITHQRRTEVALRDTDQRLKSLINAIPGGILILEFSDPIKFNYFNDTVCEILGMTRAEFQSRCQDATSLIYEPDLPLVRRILHSFSADPLPFGETFRVVRKDQELRWVRLSGAPIITVDGMLLCNCVCMDVSSEKESELKLAQAFNKIQYRSEHDTLTDIWNRETFKQKTHDLLALHSNGDYVLLAMNIQRFKVINELLGASVGDEVLRTLSRALERMFGSIGICGRMEADHFMACFPMSALDMDRIIKELDQELKMQHSDYRIELYYGIYQIHNAHIQVDQMCERATMALETIKGSAIKRFAFYDDTMRKNLLEEQEIIEEMHDALAKGQFIPYLQPIFSLNTLKTVSAEVLVRWKHPVKGLIPPSLFIPLFERNGFITKLDFSIWEQACQLLYKWKAEGLPVVPVSINISRIDLYHPHLCEHLLALLKKYDLDISLLKLEITESAYTDDPDIFASVLKGFREAGFQILMDDFGSGYSSLNTLKDMPINIMKIDMCFLAELEGSPRAASILTSVARMAKWLDMLVVAEGIETKAQLDFLHSIGCDMGQGYFFSKPLPPEDFQTLLQTTKTDALAPQRNVTGTIIDLDLLWNSGAEVNLLFNGMIGGMAICEMINDELRVRRVNDDYYHVVNCKPQQVFGNALGYLPPEGQELLLCACKNAVDSGDAQVVTVRRKLEDEQPAWLEYRIRHLETNDAVSAFFFIVKNVNVRD